MPLTYAHDKDKNRIEADSAKKGETYTCLYCDAKIYLKTSSKGVKFFACYPKVKHTDSFCEHISRQKRTHSSKDFSIKPFIDSLSKVDPHRSHPSSTSSPGDSDESTTPSTSESEETEYAVTTFTSLRQMGQEEIFRSLRPDDSFGDALAKDIFIFNYPRWYEKCLIGGAFKGGSRIVQAKPKMPLPKLRILFICFYRKNDGSYLHTNFQAAFKDKKTFKAYLNKTLKKEYVDGKSKWVAEEGIDWTLIGGYWESIEDEYFPKRKSYQCKITNMKQIYNCKEMDLK